MKPGHSELPWRKSSGAAPQALKCDSLSDTTVSQSPWTDLLNRPHLASSSLKMEDRPFGGPRLDLLHLFLTSGLVSRLASSPAPLRRELCNSSSTVKYSMARYFLPLEPLSWRRLIPPAGAARRVCLPLQLMRLSVQLFMSDSTIDRLLWGWTAVFRTNPFMLANSCMFFICFADGFHQLVITGGEKKKPQSTNWKICALSGFGREIILPTWTRFHGWAGNLNDVSKMKHAWNLPFSGFMHIYIYI